MQELGLSELNADERKAQYKEDKAKWNEQWNAIRKAKKDMDQLETSIDKLKEKAATLQKEMDDQADAGWTILANLTKQLHRVNEQIEEKESSWMELAEFLEMEA